MPKLLLASGADTIDLNEIDDKGVGFQAKSGVTGLGLPPVSVQWLEGAGDGAVFRRTRVQSRDIDVPIEILASDRVDLQAKLSRLALVLAGGCTLVLVDDDGSTWTTEVHRVGGGEYTYGEDSIGETEFQTVITFRAGDPYFTSSQQDVRTVSGAVATSPFLSNLVAMTVAPSQAIGSIDLLNTGDAPAYPVWEVRGPGDHFVATSPTGETLKWNGTLTAGQKLIIDTRKGTVQDETGANRYDLLDAAPRFWTVQPGASTATASLLNTTSASQITCSWYPRKWMVI
ncbi:minor tail protein [Streptomyces phage Sentinel]|uniref:Minor tail protein n=1 Tax=Streptomyces phage Sentinel TaxID=2767584 RepID=A0A873WI44_9CAUD|nr:minor tail protein [Streptomyces phage Sentinel]QPB09848.1 minor tail protein [Streptomyces phage Sentinel]